MSDAGQKLPVSRLDSLLNPTFIIAETLLLIVAGVVASVFVWGDAAVQNVVAGTVVGVGLGGVVGFYFGTSKSSQTKDETIAKAIPPAEPPKP